MRLKNRYKFKKRRIYDGSACKFCSPKLLNSLVANYRPFLLVFLSIICYYNSVDGSFVFDDLPAIVSNPVVRQPKTVADFFINDFWGHPITDQQSHKSFRPLTSITFALNYALFGLSPRSYHIVNIALHGINVLLVYSTVIRLLRLLLSSLDTEISFICAILFAVHPIHTEAVANIVGRAELLMTTFVMITVSVYIDGISYGYFSPSRSVVIVVTAVCSVLSKEQGIVALPICLIAEDIHYRRSTMSVKCQSTDDTNCATVGDGNKQFFHTNLKIHNSNGLPYHRCAAVALLLFLCALRMFINGFQTPLFSSYDNPVAFHPSIYVRAINRLYLLNYHVYLLIYPVNLCFDYSMGCMPLIETFSDLKLLTVVFSSLVIVGVITFCMIYLNSYRLELFALLITALSFLPASSLLVTVGFAVAERVLYLPSFGFCLFCSSIYYRFAKWRCSKDISNFGLVLLTTFAIAKCIKRSSEWKTEFTLYRSGLEVCPNNAKIHYNLGKVFAQAGDWNAAKLNYQTAIQLEPSYPFALNNLANINLQQQKFKDAEELLKKCVKLQPKFPAAWMNLGIAYMRQKQFQKAEDSFTRALKIRPRHPDCLYNVGNLYLQLGRKQDALRVWKNVTSLDQRHKRAWLNLLILLDELGKCNEVIGLSSTALSALPDDAPIHSQVGTCYGKLGFFQKAQLHLLKALHLQPTEQIYLRNLDVLYSRWRQVQNEPKTNPSRRKIIYVEAEIAKKQHNEISSFFKNHS